jgi:predicted regulator of Ras-like GTPase activity (Roadblock/LC7/MglB family)
MENLNSPDEADYLGELDEAVANVLQEQLRSIRETLNGRFLQLVVVTHDGLVVSAASADLDDPDDILSRMVAHIADAAIRAAQLLPSRTIN